MCIRDRKFTSSPGKRDGLYWETPPGAKPSPLGSLVAQARTEGYSAGQARPRGTPWRPYHGYYFKILKRQGPHAPGGSFSYVLNGNMVAGYALFAYPDKWGSSGIMTFIVNQQGRVYEKNLGPRTGQIAAGIVEYDPDAVSYTHLDVYKRQLLCVAAYRRRGNVPRMPVGTPPLVIRRLAERDFNLDVYKRQAIDSAEKRAPGPSSWEPSFTVRDLLPGPSRTLQACRNHASDPVATQAVWLYPACIRRVP